MSSFIINMKVSFSDINYQKHSQTAFGDCTAKSKSQYGTDLLTHFTYIGRDYFDRVKLADYVIDLTKEYNKRIEMVFCGCSDCSEVFDMVMALKKRFDEKGIKMDKFPSFTAFDKNPELINLAKNGRINIAKETIQTINEKYQGYNFFTNEAPIVDIECDNLGLFKEKTTHEIQHSYKFDSDLLKYIEFHTGEMLDKFKGINSDVPQIVFCRNVARYNSEQDQIKAARMLAKNLKHRSLVIIGFRDENIDISNYLRPYCRENTNPLPMVEEMRKTSFVHMYDLDKFGSVYQKIDLLPKNKFLRRIVKFFR